MLDIKQSVLLPGVFVCSVIAVQIEFALAFAWKNVSRNIVSCEYDDVQLTWEYDLNPGEYIKAKTWFTGESKTAKRIAYWKDTDGLKIEPAYTDRVTIAGTRNDSLILRRVTTSDEGVFTLLASFPLSAEPDPRLALKLSVYVPPLQENGCRKPEINATNNELHAFLDSELGCGKPAPIMNWNISRNKFVRNDTLILGDNDRGGIYKVCLIGPAVATCFKGDRETLCVLYTVQTEQPPQRISLSAEVWIGISFAILLSIVTVLTAIWFRKRRKKTSLDATDVKFLSKEQVHIYKEHTISKG